MKAPKIKMIKIIFAIMTLVIFSREIVPVAYAQEEEEYVHPDCEEKKIKFIRRFCTFKRDPLALGHNITLTVVDTAKSAVLDVPSMFISERNFDQLEYCAAVANPNESTPELPSSMQTDDDCSDLQVASILTGKYGYPTNNTSTGSLMGLANAAQDVVYNEPIPVNLAYYAKHTAQKIPVINNTAFAQEEIEGDYILGNLIGAWEAIRNVSYGVLALVMVIIGIMIMIRHKINPQTVVTIQTAIPRVVIAVLLITFSYPIGAMAIALITPLSALAVGLLPLSEVAGGTILPISTLMVILGMNALVAGAGLAIMLLIVIMILVGLFVLIKLLVQMLVVYMKIIYSVLVAPLLFAWSAAPGNEKLVADWFKKLAVNVVTIPAMMFGLNLGVYMALVFTSSVTQASADVLGNNIGAPIAGAFQAGFLAPVIVTIVFWQVGKFPKMIEEGILGKKR